jgi:hypothetical protein
MANRFIASRLFKGILYARLLVFRIFLENASNMSGGIREEHKHHWLLLQIAPTILLKSDPFRTLMENLRDAPDGYLSTQIGTENNTIDTLLNSQKLFCVLDEAQVPTELASKCFRSRQNPGEDRPILSELIVAWNESFPDLIVSGTGISMENIEVVLGSNVAKEGSGVRTFTDLGVFDFGEGQLEYMKQYLPSEVLDTKLELRAAYWLHGR